MSPTASLFLSISEELVIAHATYIEPDTSKREPPRYASTKLFEPLNAALKQCSLLRHHVEMANMPKAHDVYTFPVSCLRDVFNQCDEHPIAIEEILELLRDKVHTLVRIRYAACSSEDLLIAATFCKALCCYYNHVESESEFEILAKATLPITERASL